MVDADATLAGPPDRDAEARLGAAIRGLTRRLADDPGLRTDAATIGRVLADDMRRLIDADDVLIGRIVAQRPDAWVFIAGSGVWAPTMVGTDLALAGSLGERSMASGVPIETTDLATDSALGGRYAELGLGTARVVPLRASIPLADGRPALGVIAVYRSGHDPYTAAERSLIDAWGEICAAEINLAERDETGRLVALRFEGALHVAVDLSSSLDPAVVLRRLLERSAALLDCERCTFLAVEADAYRIIDTYDVDSRLSGTGGGPYRRQPLFHAAVASGQAVIDGGVDLGELSDAMPPDARAAVAEPHHSIVLPLIVEGRTVGLLAVYRRREPPFSAADVEMLRLVGGVGALALRNAELHRATQDAGRRLAELERMKSELLRLASHELRGPIGVLRGYLSMLDDGSLGAVPPAMVQVIPLMMRKLDESNTLIDEMLETSRLEEGRVELVTSDVDLLDVTRQVVSVLAPLSAHHRVLVHADDTSPVRVRGDARRIATIVTNLVGNAVKYSPAGGDIDVNIRQAADVVVIAVQDRGLGIEAADIPRLFTRFGRIVTRENGHISGTGLGLYLSRELARMHGGDIDVVSAPGAGSTFTLRLPRQGPAGIDNGAAHSLLPVG